MSDQKDNTGFKETTGIQRAFALADLAPILGLILLGLALYYPLLLGKPVMPDSWERLEPWNSELGFSGHDDPNILHTNFDAVLMYSPWNKIAHDELRKGNIPAWDPYCLSGVPLLQNHLVPVYYPVYALIAWLFPPLMILGASGVLHTLIMAIFFYLFLKEWLACRIASWAAASFLVVSLLPTPYYQPWPMTMAFFPGIWFFHERWLKHQNPWAGLWMALCWSVPLLAGYPTLLVHFGLFTAVWFFIRGRMIDRVIRPSWKASLKILVWPFILGLGISMVQNIPTLMASALSDRIAFQSFQQMMTEYTTALQFTEPWQNHFQRLLQPILPLRLGFYYPHYSGYVGVIPFTFALLGLVNWRQLDFPRSLAIIALIITPFALNPTLNNLLSIPTRAIFILPTQPLEILGFIILIFSAIGVKHWKKIAALDKPVGVTHSVALIPALIGIVIALAGILLTDRSLLIPTGDPYVLTIAGAVIIFSAFYTISKKYIYFGITLLSACFIYSAIMSGTFVLSDFKSPYSRNPIPATETIQSLQRMISPEAGGQWGRIIRYANNSANPASLEDQPYNFYPNLGTFFGIPDAFGYHNLVPKSRFDLLRDIQEESVIKRRGIAFFTPPVDLYDRRLFDMGIRYVLSDSSIEGLIPKSESDNFFVYDLYDQPGYTAQPPTRLSIIPSDEAYVESGSNDPNLLSQPEIRLDEPGFFAAETRYDFPGLLVLNEGYAPGWTVEVDGEAREMKVHGNFAMAVEIGSGEHTVEFRYLMPGLKEGMSVAMISIFAWVVIGIFITHRSINIKINDQSSKQE